MSKNTYIQIGNYINKLGIMSDLESKIEGVEVEISAEDAKFIEEQELLEAEAEKIKKKYKIKKTFLIEVEDEDSEDEDAWAKAWIRKPTLKEFSAFSKIAQNDNIGGLKVLLTNIFLEGDKRILEDDEFFLSAMTQLEAIINVQASRIKKF
tara:strand:- start:114 stop:566 length:453 start_codon:yes stop_codon:yes gene_type:complete